MSQNKQTLELCVSIGVGLLVLGAFIAALTYDFVSARAPIVILVPLLLLSFLQIKRAWKGAKETDLMADLGSAFTLKNSNFNGITGFFGWVVYLSILIYVAGHYAGILIFMFFLMHLVAEEKLPLSLITAVVVTAIIYMLFEHLFNIELYRGLIYRVWAGYGL